MTYNNTCDLNKTHLVSAKHFCKKKGFVPGNILLHISFIQESTRYQLMGFKAPGGLAILRDMKDDRIITSNMSVGKWTRVGTKLLAVKA